MVVQEQCVLRVGEIEVWHNPREFFDPAQMRELEDSIRANGVMQPILVRKGQRPDEKFRLIAGERRWRAAKAVFGDDGLIPALVRDCDDAQAEVLALVENSVRADMAPTEEAQAADRIVARCNGDHQEAAAMLGWTQGKLNRRLALMRLTDKVRGCLNRREIQLGHAELLAALPQDRQDSTLDKIVTHHVSVAQVKAQLGRMAQELSKAAFDKKDCVGCEFNSSCQSALFAEALQQGFCTNTTCWSQKTDEHVENIARQMREEVPRVEVLRSGESINVIPLVEGGRLGVGEAQAQECRSCAKFGCTVSSIDGSVGVVESGLCFDTDCNTRKVSANVKAMRDAEQARNEASKVVVQRGGNVQEAARAGEQAAKAKQQEAAAKSKAAGTDEKALTAKVQEFREALWRKVGAKVMFSRPAVARAVLVAIAVTNKGSSLNSMSSKIDAVVEKVAKVNARRHSEGSLSMLSKMLLESSTDSQCDTLVTALAPSAMRVIDKADVLGLMTLMNVDLTAHWHIDMEFMELLTKTQIEAVADELGITVALGAAAMNKAKAGKRDEFLKVVMGAKDYDYKGKVPGFMQPWRKAEAVAAVDHAEALRCEGSSDSHLGEGVGCVQ